MDQTLEPEFILSTPYEKDTSVDENVGSHRNKIDTTDMDQHIHVLEERLGESHQDVIFAIHKAGDACEKTRHFSQALKYYTRSLSLKKEYFHKHHPSTADTLSSIGQVTMHLGKEQTSRRSFETALMIYKQANIDRSWEGYINDTVQFKTNYVLHFKIGSTSSSLGGIQFQKKDYKEAMMYFKEALRESEEAAKHASTILSTATDDQLGNLSLTAMRLHQADVLNNIASVHVELGQKKEAISTYHKALNIQMTELGEDDPCVANTLHNMGTMNYRYGELQFAMKSYKQVLKMRRNLLGSEHCTISDVLLSISMVHMKENDYDRAEAILSSALRIAIKGYGFSSVQSARIKDVIGTIHFRTGREDSALDFHKDALRVCKEARLDKFHPLVVLISNNIAHIKCTMNQDDRDDEEEEYEEREDIQLIDEVAMNAAGNEDDHNYDDCAPFWDGFLCQ